MPKKNKTVFDGQSCIVSSVALQEYWQVVQDAGGVFPLQVTGNSMSPFLRDRRDTVFLAKPDRPLKKGDIALYRRNGGAYVLHRIKKVSENGIYCIGDAQSNIEGPLPENAVLGIAKSALRNKKNRTPKSPIWQFYARVWLNIIPLRASLCRLAKIFR